MKLKHRIAGTILALVFAATSALPAATIPQLKSPPKTVNAPKIPVVTKVPAAPKVPVVPKAVTAPKVPVVPKVASAPKIPAVKVPSVKAPKVPKIPAVKAPVAARLPKVKAPATPKIPAVAKAPAKMPATPKTPAVTTQAITSKVNPKIISNSNTGKVAAVSGIRQAVRSAQQDNPKTAPDAGVKTDLPGLPARDVKIGGRSSGEKPGTGTGTPTQDLIDVLSGKGSGTGSTGLFGDVLPKRDAPALTDISQSGKTFDQGFASAPDVSGFDKGSLNPMSGISSGGSTGGILGVAADKSGNGNPSGGLAGMGTSLISDGGAASSGGQATYSDDEGVKGRGDNKGLFQLLKERFGISEKQANETVKATVGIGNNRNGSEFLNDPNGDPAPATQPAGGTAATEPEPLKTQTSSDGRNTVVTDPDGTKNVYVDGKKVGTIAPDGTVTPAEGVSQPDPENEGTTKVDIVSQSPALQQQIRQARSGKKGSQGGSADATPVEDGISGVANGVVITQQGTIAARNNLLGNPGQSGGLREGGTAHAPVRSNGSGVVTPTNDQNMSSTGARQDDPGDFFGNGVRPDTSRLNNSTTNNNSSSNGDNEDKSGNTTSKKKK
ncbi:MAG: hypothetical protein ACO1TE_29660 [Prosthecobacter sp.]